MSSSKIIKSGAAGALPIADFRFEFLADQPAGDRTADPQAEFIPFMRGLAISGGGKEIAGAANPANQESRPTGEVADEAAVPTGISEEELFCKVQESYARGYEEGQRQAERGLGNVFKALRDAISEISGLRGRIFRESEEDLLKLAVVIAGKIIQQEVSQDRLIVGKVVGAAVEGACDRDEIAIRLNPDDHRLITQHRQLYLINGAGDRTISFKPDEGVSLGGCIVETSMGEIDARLETQLEEIYKHLLEERDTRAAVAQSLISDREQHAYDEA